jgi:hypothetical protein
LARKAATEALVCSRLEMSTLALSLVTTGAALDRVAVLAPSLETGDELGTTTVRATEGGREDLGDGTLAPLDLSGEVLVSDVVVSEWGLGLVVSSEGCYSCHVAPFKTVSGLVGTVYHRMLANA